MVSRRFWEGQSKVITSASWNERLDGEVKLIAWSFMVPLQRVCISAECEQRREVSRECDDFVKSRSVDREKPNTTRLSTEHVLGCNLHQHHSITDRRAWMGLQPQHLRRWWRENLTRKVGDLTLICVHSSAPLDNRTRELPRYGWLCPALEDNQHWYYIGRRVWRC